MTYTKKEREEKNKGEPKFGHVYALTGTSSDKTIHNGNSWAESEVSKKKTMAKKMKTEKEPFFGLPSEGRDTPQLRKRFKNYIAHMKKNGGLGWLDKQDNYKLLRDNNYYEFNKPQFD